MGGIGCGRRVADDGGSARCGKVRDLPPIRVRRIGEPRTIQTEVVHRHLGGYDHAWRLAMVTATKTTKTGTTKKAPVRLAQKRAAAAKRSARSLADTPDARAKSQSADSMLQDLRSKCARCGPGPIACWNACPDRAFTAAIGPRQGDQVCADPASPRDRAHGGY